MCVNRNLGGREKTEDKRAKYTFASKGHCYITSTKPTSSLLLQTAGYRHHRCLVCLAGMTRMTKHERAVSQQLGLLAVSLSFVLFLLWRLLFLRRISWLVSDLISVRTGTSAVWGSGRDGARVGAMKERVNGQESIEERK